MLETVAHSPKPFSRPTAARRLTYWALQLCGWSLYFWAQASGEVIFADTPWSKSAAQWGGFCACGMGLTHLLRWIIKRGRWLSLPPRSLIIRMVLAVALLASVLDVTTIALAQLIYHVPVAPIIATFYRKLPLSGQFINQFVNSFIVTLIWVGLYLSLAVQRHRYDEQLQKAELSQLLHAAELRLLKAQLNPHFLFNALNGVRALIPDEPARAQDAVTQLSRALRYTLASSEEEFVSLARELEMVNDYLALESMRLGDRLTIVREIAAEAAQHRVPVMLIQTLIENAIKHGIAEIKQGGVLRIEAKLAATELLVRVVNPRPGNALGTSSQGTGLKNSSERLRLLFGNRASLRLDLSQAGEAIAEVRLPP